METLEELNTQLLLVNTAIQRLIGGENITEFNIGSGSSSRKYTFSEVNLDNLNSEKSTILRKIDNLSGTEVTFRESSFMQTVYKKDFL